MGLVTIGRRAVLRSLKMEFDALFAGVDLSMDRSNPEYVEAEEAYKEWRKAIDAEALDLLTDLDRAEEAIARLHEELKFLKMGPNASLEAQSPEVDAVALFETIDAAKRNPDANNPDPTPEEAWGEKPPEPVRQLGSSLWIYPPNWTDPP